MDPNVAYQRCVEAANEILTELGNTDGPDLDVMFSSAETLAESFDVLNEWLKKGGFLPKKWERKEKS